MVQRLEVWKSVQFFFALFSSSPISKHKGSKSDESNRSRGGWGIFQNKSISPRKHFPFHAQLRELENHTAERKRRQTATFSDE